MKIFHSIIKAFKAIFAIIMNPWLLNKVLQEPDLWKKHVIKKYDRERGLPMITFEQLFGKEFSSELDVFTFLDGGSMVTDLVLIKELAAQIKDCKYFEIGTWRGESAINVSANADVCYTLNLSDEEMRKMKVDEKTIELQGFFSKHADNIVHLKAHSNHFDYKSLNTKFDLIFIDGSHHYEDVKNDTKNIFEHLTHDKTIVVWHDYAITPEEIRYEVLAGILDGTDEKFHTNIYHVANTKSAIFVQRDFESKYLDAPVTPELYFSVAIKGEKNDH